MLIITKLLLINDKFAVNFIDYRQLSKFIIICYQHE